MPINPITDEKQKTLRNFCRKGDLNGLRKIVSDDNILRYDQYLSKELLLIACKYDKIDIVAHIIGSLIYVPEENDYRGLYLACKYNCPAIVEFLLKLKTINISVNGYKCLKVAIEKKHVEIVKILCIELCSNMLVSVFTKYDFEIVSNDDDDDVDDE